MGYIKNYNMNTENIEIIIERLEYTKTATYGKLTINGKEFYTLEPFYTVQNIKGSAIPQGTYRVNLRYTPTRKKHLHINNVPNRTHILIHTGNTYCDTIGCVLVGTKRSGSIIKYSRKALDAILQEIGDKNIIITIKNM